MDRSFPCAVRPEPAWLTDGSLEERVFAFVTRGRIRVAPLAEVGTDSFRLPVHTPPIASRSVVSYTQRPVLPAIDQHVVTRTAPVPPAVDSPAASPAAPAAIDPSASVQASPKAVKAAAVPAAPGRPYRRAHSYVIARWTGHDDPAAEERFSSGGSDHLRYALAQRSSKRDEDAYYATSDGKLPAAFAVFDGHSGQRCARSCAEQLCQLLLRQGPPFTHRSIEEAFWGLDKELGLDGCTDGASALVVMLEEEAGGVRGTIAWCGDVHGVVSDVANGRVLLATKDHIAGPEPRHDRRAPHKRERARLRWLAAARDAVEKAHGISTIESECTAVMVSAALDHALVAKARPKMWDDGVGALQPTELLTRALRRGLLIAHTHPEHASARKNAMVRQRARRHDKLRPWVVSTGRRHTEAGYRDLLTTRSIGDWKASNLVLPTPQFASFVVPVTSTFRVALASKGAWKATDDRFVAKCMQVHAKVEAAAGRWMAVAEKAQLGSIAKQAKLPKDAPMVDDTTMLIVEINPSGSAHDGVQRSAMGHCLDRCLGSDLYH